MLVSIYCKNYYVNMNSKNIELMELMEARKELEEAEKGSWNAIWTALGGGFVFSVGCIGSYYWIEKTPRWAFWLGIVAAILTILVCFLFYALYRENGNNKKKLEVKIKKLKAEMRAKEL